LHNPNPLRRGTFGATASHTAQRFSSIARESKFQGPGISHEMMTQSPTRKSWRGGGRATVERRSGSEAGRRSATSVLAGSATMPAGRWGSGVLERPPPTPVAASASTYGRSGSERGSQKAALPASGQPSGDLSTRRFRTIQDRPKDFPPCLRHGEVAEPPSSALGGGQWRHLKTIGRWRTGQRSSLLGALPPA
jgi:hypothetical protein